MLRGKTKLGIPLKEPTCDKCRKRILDEMYVVSKAERELPNVNWWEYVEERFHKFCIPCFRKMIEGSILLSWLIVNEGL